MEYDYEKFWADKEDVADFEKQIYFLNDVADEKPFEFFENDLLVIETKSKNGNNGISQDVALGERHNKTIGLKHDRIVLRKLKELRT